MKSAVEVVDAVEESGEYLSKPDEVHDWLTRVRVIGVFRFGYLPDLRAFVLMLNSCCTAPFPACSGWYE